MVISIMITGPDKLKIEMNLREQQTSIIMKAYEEK